MGNINELGTEALFHALDASKEPTPEQKEANPHEVTLDASSIWRAYVREDLACSRLRMALAKRMRRVLPTFTSLQLLDFLGFMAKREPFFASCWDTASAFDEIATKMEAAAANEVGGLEINLVGPDDVHTSLTLDARELAPDTRSLARAYVGEALAYSDLKEALTEEMMRREPTFSLRRLVELLRLMDELEPFFAPGPYTAPVSDEMARKMDAATAADEAEKFKADVLRELEARGMWPGPTSTEEE